MLDVSEFFTVVCSSQSQVLAVQRQMSDVTVQPLSEQQQEEVDEDEVDEDEDDEDEVDEEWAWCSAGGDLSKRYNRAGFACQVTHADRFD